MTATDNNIARRIRVPGSPSTVVVFEAIRNAVNMNYGMSLSLWESRALRPGEGPSRPLGRPTLPQAGG